MDVKLGIGASGAVAHTPGPVSVRVTLDLPLDRRLGRG